jgi:thymidylate kinase
MLILIEGLDLTGKTTLAHSLAESIYLTTNRRVPVFAEPARNRFGRFVRESLGAKTRGGASSSWPHETWIVVFLAAMVEQDAEIRSYLAKGDVIVDRRELSTLAYQADGRPDLVRVVWAAASVLAKPDALVFLDGDPATLAGRKSNRTADNGAHESLVEQVALRAAYGRARSTWTAYCGHE